MSAFFAAGLAAAIADELGRREKIELIASENIVSKAPGSRSIADPLSGD